MTSVAPTLPLVVVAATCLILAQDQQVSSDVPSIRQQVAVSRTLVLTLDTLRLTRPGDEGPTTNTVSCGDRVAVSDSDMLVDEWTGKELPPRTIDRAILGADREVLTTGHAVFPSGRMEGTSILKARRLRLRQDPERTSYSASILDSREVDEVDPGAFSLCPLLASISSRLEKPVTSQLGPEATIDLVEPGGGMYLPPLEQLRKQVNLAREGNAPLAASSLPLGILMSNARGEIVLRCTQGDDAEVTFDVEGQLDVAGLLGLDKGGYAHEIRWEFSGSAHLKHNKAVMSEYTLKGSLAIIESIDITVEGDQHVNIVAEWNGTRELEMHWQ